MRTVLILRAAALVAAAVVAAGCGDDGQSAASGSGATSVVAGFHPLAEAAARVGGERVSVDDLTPPGAEPHDLEVGPDEVEAVQGADLVVVLGGGFQPGIEELAGRRPDAALALLETPAGEGGPEGDPHLWLDPTRMAAVVDEVAARLAEIDPDGADDYRRNAADYREELLALDRRFEEGLAGCAGDLLVVQHEAFGWLADRYGLRQEGITGLAPEQEPDPRRMAELVELVQDEGVRTVFTEPLLSRRVARALAREAGVATATLNPIEGLTDEERAAGETYVSLMDANLGQLRDGLGCG